MTLDKLTIRIYKEPSYLVMVDGHVCRYYSHLNQMIPLSEEMEAELYCHIEEWYYGATIEEWLDNQAKSSFESFAVEINGKFYRYYSEYEDIILADSLPPQNCPFSTVTWFELPESLRTSYVLENYPDASQEEYYVMVYGKEKADKLIEHEQWITSHIVYDYETTCDIEVEIGRFDNVKQLDSGYLFPDNTDLDKTKYYRFLLDERWLVTVIEREDQFDDIRENLMFYTPKDSESALMLNKINQLSELPYSLLNILDLKPE